MAPGGGDRDDQGEGSGMKPDETRKGRWHARHAPQPEANQDSNNYEQCMQLSRIMGNAMGRRTRVPVEPPAQFKNQKHDYMRRWLLRGPDLLGQNSWQWEDEPERIQYAISGMDWKEVSPFMQTSRQQITEELAYTKQAGYEFRHVFAEQALQRFIPTHGREKARREMGVVRYLGDITKFLLEMESLNIHARITGIASRKMIQDEIPEDALRRLSLREYVDDGEWLEAVRTFTRMEEDLRERKGL